MAAMLQSGMQFSVVQAVLCWERTARWLLGQEHSLLRLNANLLQQLEQRPVRVRLKGLCVAASDVR